MANLVAFAPHSAALLKVKLGLRSECSLVHVDSSSLLLEVNLEMVRKKISWLSNLALEYLGAAWEATTTAALAASVTTVASSVTAASEASAVTTALVVSSVAAATSLMVSSSVSTSFHIQISLS